MRLSRCVSSFLFRLFGELQTKTIRHATATTSLFFRIVNFKKVLVYRQYLCKMTPGLRNTSFENEVGTCKFVAG